jgi:LPS O-antigen subunit length determinant protein (WzzB/FepE family)
MTKKLEEALNLPNLEELLPEELEEEQAPTTEEVKNEIATIENEMSMVDRANIALPTVEGLEQLDREMDEYATKAMETFEDLVDLGKNVEDRHAAPIFDSAAKMIAAALQAKQAKMDKKMKMIELQMRQARLEKDSQKIDAYVAGKKHEIGDEEDIEGRIIGDRSAMLAEIMKNLDEKDK